MSEIPDKDKSQQIQRLLAMAAAITERCGPPRPTDLVDLYAEGLAAATLAGS